MNTVENGPQEVEPSRQSPYPPNWSDYLHVENDMDKEGVEQTEPLTDANSTNPLLCKAHVYHKILLLILMLF